MRVFLTHSTEMFHGFYGDRALDGLREVAEVRMNQSGIVLDDPGALIAAAGDAQILVADRRTPIPAEIFAALPDLVAVCRVAVDISTIDVAAANRHGVLVTRATPGFADAVVELTLGLLVDLARGISTCVTAYRAGAEPPMRMGRQLRGATLGIVGYGVIGQRLAALGQALGMQVLVDDPHRTVTQGDIRQVGFIELLANADYVVCLAVSVPETYHLMDTAAFSAMRRGSCFLNLSRGELVDEAALLTALENGHLAGAAMDVGSAADQKPALALASRADVIATPHIGGMTAEAAEHQAFDTVRQVAALVAGKLPPGSVNADQATRWRS
jgi:D-3-phosphoglycerate dehydrogenase